MTTLKHLTLAISLAKQAKRENIKGNPFVGAIVVSETGEIIGSGFHEIWGGKHAEVFAIEEALLKTSDLSSCTLYVTLEPCSHLGKTPPCTDLILKTGIKNIIVGSLDPNPKVSGFNLLKEHGVNIQLLDTKEAIELNKVFFTNQTKQRPFVALKMAATLDGKIADYLGSSKWITNEKSRNYLHANIRSQVDAIISTAKTVLTDQSTLNCRIPGKEVNEVNAVIIDQTGQLLQASNKQHPIFYKRTHTQIYLITAPGAVGTNFIPPPHVSVVAIEFDTNNKINLTQLGKKLIELGIYSVLVEAGSMFCGSLLESGWADEIHYFIGSKILADTNALPVFRGNKQVKLAASVGLTLKSFSAFDNDIYLHYAIDSL